MHPDAIDLAAFDDLTARIFPGLPRPELVRVQRGVSTCVYRTVWRGEVFYLRVLPAADQTFGPEVYAHSLLRARGVSVPEVVYFEHRNEAIGRSIMVDRAVPGIAIGDLPAHTDHPDVLQAAGRDLAVINSVPVAGFGWIERQGDAYARLEGRHPDHRSFMRDGLSRDLALLEGSILASSESSAVRHVLECYDCWLDGDRSTLAHGDIRAAHVYTHNGRYSGLIDLGAIRGAGPLFDLARIRLRDLRRPESAMLPSVLEGYCQVQPLLENCQERIDFLALVLSIGITGRFLRDFPGADPSQSPMCAIRSLLPNMAAW